MSRCAEEREAAYWHNRLPERCTFRGPAPQLARGDANVKTQPLTLHPTPYTLHPTPYTLHPTPYTLKPKP